MKAKDLLTLAIVGGAAFLAYRYFSAGKSAAGGAASGTHFNPLDFSPWRTSVNGGPNAGQILNPTLAARF